MAISEAKRCLGCKNKPCVAQCPVMIDIPAFIEKVAQDDMDAAFNILSADTSLPAVCGRVCPQETQCEQVCVRNKKGRQRGNRPPGALRGRLAPGAQQPKPRKSPNPTATRLP